MMNKAVKAMVEAQLGVKLQPSNVKFISTFSEQIPFAEVENVQMYVFDVLVLEDAGEPHEQMAEYEICVSMTRKGTA